MYNSKSDDGKKRKRFVSSAIGITTKQCIIHDRRRDIHIKQAVTSKETQFVCKQVTAVVEGCSHGILLAKHTSRHYYLLTAPP